MEEILCSIKEGKQKELILYEWDMHIFHNKLQYLQKYFIISI